MVDVAAAVEVDEGLEGDLLGWGGGGRCCSGELFGGGVVGVYVCGVVFAVVEFHYLTRDGGFEGGVGVWSVDLVSMGSGESHGAVGLGVLPYKGGLVK